MDRIPHTPGIYVIRNLVNGHIYIGSAVSLAKRKRQHFSDLRCNRHKNRHLQSAANKHGIDSFAFDVLEHVSNTEDLIAREQHFIDLMKPHYNLSPTAQNTLGFKFSPEQAAKMGIVRRGQKRTDEQKQRMSEAIRGRKYSVEAKANMSKAHKGKNHTPETLAKMSATRRGKKFTPEHSAKIAKAKLGKRHSIEAREKMSRTRKGVPKSPEFIAKREATRRANRLADRAAKEQERIANEQALLARWENAESPEPIDPGTYKPLSLFDIDGFAS